MADTEYFTKTKRLGLRWWRADDVPLAHQLWGDPQVTELLEGPLTMQHVAARLELELLRARKFGMQYWPLFMLDDAEFVGCCGLQPHGAGVLELGFHLRPQFWHRGLAGEAAGAALSEAFGRLAADAVYAGHHPSNAASASVLRKLGFAPGPDEFFERTGLMHPSYMLTADDYAKRAIEQ